MKYYFLVVMYQNHHKLTTSVVDCNGLEKKLGSGARNLDHQLTALVGLAENPG